jgi:hypothetical protein
LHDEATIIRSSPRKLKYWGIADFATQRALTKGDAAYLSKVISALESLIDYASIGKPSTSLISFDLARLYLKRGDTDKAKAALDSARKENRKIVDKRVTLTRDLESLT